MELCSEHRLKCKVIDDTLIFSSVDFSDKTQNYIDMFRLNPDGFKTKIFNGLTVEEGRWWYRYYKRNEYEVLEA